MNESFSFDQRRHKRSEFAYPVDFKILSQNLEATVISGYIENISISGVGILFEDKYGRINPIELKGTKIKLAVIMPDGEKISLIALIRWVSKDPVQKFHIHIGVEFENVEDWQLIAIKKLIKLKNKDHNMMWNLWEHYENQS